MIKQSFILSLLASAAFALEGSAAQPSALGLRINGLADANPVIVSDTDVSTGFVLDPTQQGQDLLENPAGVITSFGHLEDGTGTEPDQNTYLILDHNPGGPTADYDYGRHFLFQGHENGSDLAYITRINLDVANPDHRVTLLTPPGQDGLTHFGSIDGSVWDPFTNTLLFSQERGSTGGVIEVGADFDPSTGGGAGLRTLYGSMGQGGYEGIRPDKFGNIWIVEDVGGTTFNFAKNPNSFIYRFVPTNTADLSQGKLQALQVYIDGEPVIFHAEDVTLSETQLKLHTVGAHYFVKWVTLHDTAVDGTDPYDANARAKAVGATPFKRPENGAFLPESDFRTFFFTITGDTDANAGNNPELAARGAWGGIFRVDLDASRESGRISLIVLGDADHASFDNIAWSSGTTILASEDRGDTLHDQLNKLDSVWAYNIKQPNSPARLIALGQDRMAINEDNEPTGVDYSEGDSSLAGLLGRRAPRPERSRLFFTQQHGEDNLYEIVTSSPSEE
jgi:hypothetical protein